MRWAALRLENAEGQIVNREMRIRRDVDEGAHRVKIARNIYLARTAIRLTEIGARSLLVIWSSTSRRH